LNKVVQIKVVAVEAAASERGGEYLKVMAQTPWQKGKTDNNGNPRQTRFHAPVGTMELNFTGTRWVEVERGEMWTDEPGEADWRYNWKVVDWDAAPAAAGSGDGGTRQAEDPTTQRSIELSNIKSAVATMFAGVAQSGGQLPDAPTFVKYVLDVYTGLAAASPAPAPAPVSKPVAAPQGNASGNENAPYLTEDQFIQNCVDTGYGRDDIASVLHGSAKVWVNGDDARTYEDAWNLVDGTLTSPPANTGKGDAIEDLPW
tara:strand:- start:1701 stop:2474 length:774 start_codon:yes stop_codon:yes gene_type:complete